MKYVILLLSLFTGLQSVAQQVPFSVEIQPVVAGPLPGMHSFAFAQSGSKWLFIGGRTNGIHGFSTNNNFDIMYANDVITVIDTATWTSYSSTLDVLPVSVADPLRSTNMEYTRIGNYLYLAGGFGWDSTANGYRTFPVLTAIHIDNMINAVVSGSAIAPNIRQITDTNFRVCGGEMAYANGECFLFFGHNFSNRYSDPPQPTFTQVYTNKIKRFTITDDGTNLSVSNFTYEVDTANYHRRDFNLGNVVHTDGSFGWCVYSGVFRKDYNLPYLSPINYDPANGAQVDLTFSQQMNNYTCAMEPLFDSVQKTMYTVLFGGESEYDYNPSNGQLTLDSLVPFVNDISVLVHTSNGQWSQVPLQVQMSGLQGSNMKFVPVSSVPAYANDVVKLRDLSGRILAGYLVGGIVSANPNLHTSTWANDTVYRVWITPDQNLLSVNEHQSENKVDVFPNPANDHVTVRAHYSGDVAISMYDAQGQLLRYEKHSGKKDVIFSTQNLAAGIYTVQVTAGNVVSQKKLVIVRNY
ncbi:MAG TPA: T9SS type A sorting domain-containing protein [Bacteroidia bacterium]|nr:T9SS type A sorting domain-containing protein [Bacteroidia bacterium]